MSHIAIIGTVGVPACYGGFETLVENLLDEKDNEHNITVYCSSKSYNKQTSKYKNAHLHFIPLKANGVQSMPYDIWSLLHAIYTGADKVLILGVSGCICLPFIRLFSKVKIVTNIDGLEWRRGKWNKFAKNLLKYSERLAVKYSDTIIADNQAIANYVTDEYGVIPEVIAYGGDHAITSALSIIDNDYAMALCRIEPENNIEMILESFSQTNKNLKFIGNWDNSDFGKKMKVKYQTFKNIEMLSPVYDLTTLFEIRQKCSFYVHGHSAGGTNPSLVEMMHFNKTILAFDCNYNKASTENSAHYFSNVDDLVALINQSDTVDNAENMLKIAERRYTWKIVKQQYLNLLN
ncbi:DUF1972 domain-containing protein [Pseudocolwellia agarivorans]|uniref:DUF1972 domain-containing protein n=1 Tax=Pseudocolwellia agarivorans TaxID=1911682 RepID=UPI0009861B14|nr:DUF1972 domain-containing protein [Pseudocolwellia agarivorans]